MFRPRSRETFELSRKTVKRIAKSAARVPDPKDRPSQRELSDEYDPIEKDEEEKGELSLFSEDELPPKKFEGPYELPHSVSLTIPSVEMGGREVELARRMAIVNLIKREMAGRFGGWTRNDAEGGYMDERGVSHSDTGDVIIAYVSEDDLESAREWIEDFAGVVKKWMDQDSVLFTVDDKATLV